jgi:hypothetical protein
MVPLWRHRKLKNMILATHGILQSGGVSIIPPLLDDYPNAAVAYSLRKLRTAYTGSAIRVRRTDLTESDIGFTSTGELDTAALLAFTGTGALNNGFVTTWYDQSGNGYNATQSNAINQPKIVSSGSVILENGKPTIENTTTNGLKTTSNVDFTSANSLNYFGVFKKTNTSTDNLILEQTTNFNSTAGAIIINNGSSTKINITQRSGSGSDTYTDNGYDLTFNNRYLFNALMTRNVIASNFSTVYANNVLLSKTISFASPSISFISNILSLFSRNGNSIGLFGNYQEVILYSSDQSSNRTGIETNINSFYSIY